MKQVPLNGKLVKVLMSYKESKKGDSNHEKVSKYSRESRDADVSCRTFGHGG